MEKRFYIVYVRLKHYHSPLSRTSSRLMSILPSHFSLSPTTLSGKTIIVTGASSELGSSVCYGAARAGATVIMLDRKQRELAPLYDKVSEQGWPEPMMVEFDIKRANEESIQRLASALDQQMPVLHGLVHCAMWGAPLSPIVNSNISTWQTILENQLLKPMMITRALIPLLKHDGQSSIVFTSLDTGRIGRAYWGGVATAFAGIENLSEILSAEYEDHRIRVNTLDPGKVKTQLRKQFYLGEAAHELRNANAPDIVNLYLYLLSDQSNDQTGQRFTVPPIS
ncbi:MAG: SDR family NAD(P)-dependent oxidoreductase [Gammaproteobacteria bacterium]|nr:SDR family NAD(P)-dependent oxidoreductase [Gammaproteobacteria bacterium]